jgi:hypothetical protein
MKLGNGGTSQYYDSANISSGTFLDLVDSSNMTSQNYQPANLFRDVAEMVESIAFISMKGTRSVCTLNHLHAGLSGKDVHLSWTSFVTSTSRISTG